jgi:hypothetical protein
MWPPWVGGWSGRGLPPPRAATQGRPYRIHQIDAALGRGLNALDILTKDPRMPGGNA